MKFDRERSSSAGYLYILENDSMPGLLKVGKTTRLPHERCTEISAATGVATPFVVVHSEQYTDCHNAEKFVHTALAEKGNRVSSNREFFDAHVADVIVLFHQAKRMFGRRNDTGLPWAEILKMAISAKGEDGQDEFSLNQTAVVAYFTEAARLGSWEAFEELGEHYLRREDPPEQEDIEMAIFWHTEGVKRGYYLCSAWLGRLYCWAPGLAQQYEARHHYRMFFDALSTDVDWQAQGIQESTARVRIAEAIAMYLTHFVIAGWEIQHAEKMQPYAGAVYKALDVMLRHSIMGAGYRGEAARKSIAWIEQHVLAKPEPATPSHVVLDCPSCDTGLRLPVGREGMVRCPSCGNSNRFST